MGDQTNQVPFEDALDKTGFGKFNYLMLMLCGGLITCMTSESYSVSYLVPASACELLTNSFHQGIMAGMPLIGILATSHFWGYYADTQGRRKIIRLSLILGFTTSALATFSPNWIVFCVLKLLSSSAVSGTFALSFTLLSECTPRSKRSIMVVLTSSMFYVAVGCMAVLAIPVLSLKFSYSIPYLNIHFNSWRVLNIIFSMPCAIGAVAVTFAYESPKYLLSAGREAEALKVLENIFAINGGKSRDDFQITSIILQENSLQATTSLWESLKSQSMPLFKPPLLLRTLLMAFVFGLIYFSTNPYMVWMPSIADSFMKSVQKDTSNITFCERIRSTQNATDIKMENDCSLNEFAITMVFGIQIYLAVANSLMSVAINYIDRKHFFLGLQLLTGTAGLCINFTSSWIITALLFIVFVTGTVNFALLTTFSVDFFPTYLKAMAMCITVMVGRVGAVLGINVLKNMLEYNCEGSFHVFAGLAVVCGLIGFLLPSDAKVIATNEKSEDKKVDFAGAT